MRWLVPFTLSLAGAIDVAQANAPRAWLDPVPSSAPPFRDLEEVPRQSFVEVPQAKRPAAMAALKSVTSVPGSANFGGDGFACSAPQRPYLVRALYGNHDTGAFQLYWANSSLIVSHSSLGHPVPPQATVLVVCLAKAPSSVYSSISSAL